MSGRGLLLIPLDDAHPPMGGEVIICAAYFRIRN